VCVCTLAQTLFLKQFYKRARAPNDDDLLLLRARMANRLESRVLNKLKSGMRTATRSDV